MGGYALVDLGFNISPNKNTEILGMIRINNKYGGFYGAGVAFDVRQLWVKGIIADVVRYQLGDINLKQTPFTLYNHNEDQMISQPGVFQLQRDIVNYETFYKSNTWRQQGLSLDWGLQFNKFVKELNFNAYLTRMNATEIRASVSLASIFGLRMLGLFLILPVFAIHAKSLPGGDNATLVGLAMGMYGLTQAIGQIPFGIASDRHGRKRIIIIGLLLFIVGALIAASATLKMGNHCRSTKSTTAPRIMPPSRNSRSATLPSAPPTTSPAAASATAPRAPRAHRSTATAIATAISPMTGPSS